METYVDDLPEPDCSYPVLIVEHKQHVIWVEADTLTDAVEQVRNDGEWYERIRDNETCASFWHEVDPPTQYDWWTVYNGGEGYADMQADAHVQVHKAVQYAAARDVKKAACAAAGHPDVKFYSSGDPYCEVCWRITPEQLVTDIRAANGSPA